MPGVGTQEAHELCRQWRGLAHRMARRAYHADRRAGRVSAAVDVEDYVQASLVGFWCAAVFKYRPELGKFQTIAPFVSKEWMRPQRRLNLKASRETAESQIDTPDGTRGVLDTFAAVNTTARTTVNRDRFWTVALASLPNRLERSIVEMLYRYGRSESEAADVFKVTRRRVRQLAQQARERLRDCPAFTQEFAA